MHKHISRISPIFSLTMTALCLVAALYTMFHDLGTGPFAVWMVAAGVWFSLAVHSANDRGDVWRDDWEARR